MATGQPIAIELSDLRDALALLLDATTDRFGPLVDLDADHYWSIEPRAVFDLSSDPEVLVGQLSDDVSEVAELMAREGREVFLAHDLEHVIGILQRIASLAQP